MAIESVLVRQSWLRASRAVPRLVPSFLDTLGWRYPSARRVVQRLFGRGSDVEARIEAFARTLAPHVGDPFWLGAALATLAASRPDVEEIPPQVIEWIKDVLLETIEAAGGRAWTTEERVAWREMLDSTRKRASAHRIRRLAS